MSKLLNVSSSPHVRSSVSTQNLMYDVAIAMLPATIWGVMQFGFYSLVVVAATVLSCVLSEYVFETLMKKPITISDGSALVTGMILGLNMPPTIPLWIPVLGGMFAIIVVKQLYGGIGKNFVNPALAGRAFLFFSWTATMTSWAVPKALGGVSVAADAVTMATPLSLLKEGSDIAAQGYDYLDMFLGFMPGSIGEISALALLIGGAYLLIRKVINWRIPVAFIGTVAVLTFIFPRNGYANLDWMLYNLLSGGLLLGAFFMATDYSSSPVTLNGQLLFGFGCGALTVLIRYFGGFPEGVSFAILIMNLCAWAIDKGTRGRQFGVTKEDLKAAKKAAKEAKA